MNSTSKISVMWINVAKEIWKRLSQRYDRDDAYRLSDLLEAFHYQKQGNMNIDKCYTRLKIMWERF